MAPREETSFGPTQPKQGSKSVTRPTPWQKGDPKIPFQAGVSHHADFSRNGRGARNTDTAARIDEATTAEDTTVDW